MAATAVAVAGVAATAASAAATASAGGKGGGGAPQMQGASLMERVFNRGTQNLLDEERQVMEDSLAQASFMQPEMYALLGFEPIYDDRGYSPENLSAMGQKADALKDQQVAGRERLATASAELRAKKAELKGLKGPGSKAQRQQVKAEMQSLRQEKKQIKANNPGLVKQIAYAQQQLGEAQTLPRRITGFKKLAGPTDPTQSKGDLYRVAFDLQNESLVRALKGEEPIDATLKTAFDEKESALRERLRRSLGEDYQDSTAGSRALANFDRERGEAFKQFNQQLVQSLSSQTESRATSLSNLTSARMQQLLYPSNTQAARALQLGQAANDRLGLSGQRQHERLAQFEADTKTYQTDQANDAARASTISSLLSNVGGGLSGAAPTVGGALDKYLGGGASPGTVTVPSY